MFFSLCICLWCTSSAIVLATHHTQPGLPDKPNLSLKLQERGMGNLGGKVSDCQWTITRCYKLCKGMRETHC